MVRPGDSLWVDVLLPAGDELWEEDVREAPRWLGRVWQRALAELGLSADLHTGPPRTGEWGRVACMAGLAPGELSVEGRKVVGLAQRRTRASARFQSIAVLAWEPNELVSLLALGESDRSALREELAVAAVGLAVGAAELKAAFLGALP